MRRTGRARGVLVAVAALAAVLAWPAVALGHAGAPYPVLVDEVVGPYRVSALADPDVGKGTFYVEVAAAETGRELPDGTVVEVAARPDDGHAAEAAYAAERRSTRYGDRYVAVVPFDTRGGWQVRLRIDGPAGRGEHTLAVTVTPPGISWVGTAACLAPFVFLAILWARAALRKKEPSTA